MKHIYLISTILFSVFLFSCSEENPEGIGSDPKLNITEYTFDAGGESLDVYSTVGGYLMFSAYQEDPPIEPIVTPPGQPKQDGIDGGWFRVYYPIPSVEPVKLPYEKLHQGIRIEVKPNDTGKERVIPIDIFAGDFGCRVKFTQAK